MKAESQRLKGQENTILVLNKAIEALNVTKIPSFPPARAVFAAVGGLLALIRVCFLLSCNNLPQIHI
jgi:hypothetical protein